MWLCYTRTDKLWAVLTLINILDEIILVMSRCRIRVVLVFLGVQWGILVAHPWAEGRLTTGLCWLALGGLLGQVRLWARAILVAMRRRSDPLRSRAGVKTSLRRGASSGIFLLHGAALGGAVLHRGLADGE